MFANTLIVVFVCSFLGIVAFGHVLLMTAIWPGLFRFKREPQLNSVAGPNRRFRHSE